jgi:predicted RNA methylase
VEITKLSLWLKTAQKGKKLANLDGNIKCGNSLIDDPEVAGDKAFVWETQFKEIFADGGFDVIVGNPPYGAQIQQIDNEVTESYLLFYKL